MDVICTTGRAERYKVHYVGWNKGHDEVLEKAKIMKCDADQSPQKGELELDIIDLSESKSPATVIKVR